MKNRFSNKSWKNKKWGDRTVGTVGRSATATPIFFDFLSENPFFLNLNKKNLKNKSLVIGYWSGSVSYFLFLYFSFFLVWKGLNKRKD